LVIHPTEIVSLFSDKTIRSILDKSNSLENRFPLFANIVFNIFAMCVSFVTFHM